MHFELYKDRSGQWRGRLVARNGKTIADSGESYSRKRGALRWVALVRSGSTAEVKELG